MLSQNYLQYRATINNLIAFIYNKSVKHTVRQFKFHVRVFDKNVARLEQSIM